MDSKYIEIHLTYADSFDAYGAFEANHVRGPEMDQRSLPSPQNPCKSLANRSGRFPEVAQVWPANTWHQPQAPQFMLDEWSDDELPAAEFNEFHIHRRPMATLRRHSKSRANQLKAIQLVYNQQNPAPKLPDRYLCDEYERRATLKVTGQVGQNLRWLIVRRCKSDEMPMELVRAMRPAFGHITRLDWHAYFTCAILSELRAACRNLRVLKVYMQNWMCDQQCRHRSLDFPALEHFHQHNVYNGEGQALLGHFIRFNPQLKHLNISIVEAKVLEAIAMHSATLEHLEIWRKPCAEHNVDGCVRLLSRLPRLRTLILRYSSTHNFADIREQSAPLSLIRQAKVIVVIRNLRAMWRERVDFVPYVHHLVEVSMDADVLSIKIGPNVRRIEMADGRRYLVNVVNTARSHCSWHPSLRDDILDEFNSVSAAFPDASVLDIFELDAACCQYVSVNSGPRVPPSEQADAIHVKGDMHS